MELLIGENLHHNTEMKVKCSLCYFILATRKMDLFAVEKIENQFVITA